MLANGTDKLKNRNASLTDALAALHPINANEPGAQGAFEADQVLRQYSS